MTASVMHLLDSLESRLEQAQAELHALRMENAQLKQQLVAQAATLQKTLEQPATTTQHTPEAAEHPQAAEPSQAVTLQAAESETHSVEATTPVPTPVSGSMPPDIEEPVPASAPPAPHSLLKEWYQRYPQVFFKGHTKPLKVGIHQDLAAREPWPGKLIRRTLANYVNLPRYLKSVREGVDRIDLDGQSAGKVDKEAALHAAQKRKEKQSGAPDKVSRPDARKEPRKEKAYSANKPGARDSQAVQTDKINKDEQEKPLSLEDKLKGLRQKFEGQ